MSSHAPKMYPVYFGAGDKNGYLRYIWTSVWYLTVKLGYVY